MDKTKSINYTVDPEVSYAKHKTDKELIEIERVLYKGTEKDAPLIDPTNEQLHAAMLTGLHDTYKRKNHDYGNSFEESLDKYGLIAGVVRVDDKFKRLESLMNKDAKVVEESLEDTILDAANYLIMMAMWLKKNKNG